MNKKTLSIVSIVTLGLTLVINAISTFGLLGVTPVKEISDKFSNLLVPMGYTFSVIWTLIYAGLIYYTVKDLTRKEDKYGINLALIASNILNALWIVTYTNGYYLVSTIVIVGLFIVLTNILFSIKDNGIDKIIFSVYTTWILIASCVSILGYLVSLNFVPFDSVLMKVISVLLVVTTLMFVLMNKNNVAMKLTYIFALAGIAANHIFKFNFMYLDLMIIVAIAIVCVLYSMFYELFKNNSREVKPYEAL